MRCLICDGEAAEAPSIAQFAQINCPKCGYYGLPVELANRVEKGNLRFHIDRTRAYLDMRAKSNQGPWITHVDIINYQLSVQ